MANGIESTVVGVLGVMVPPVRGIGGRGVIVNAMPGPFTCCA